MPTHPRRAPVLFVAAILVAACGTTTKYVAPNAPAPVDAASPAPQPQPSAPPVSACIQACQTGREFALRKKDRKPIYDHECLAKCPEVRVVDGGCEKHEKPPNGFCVEKREENPVAKTIGQAIGGTILLALLIAGLAASVDK